MPLGDKIKELRVKNGLSQEELAEKLNRKFNASINKGMISKWENHLVEPRLDVARMLAQFFNISADELLGIRPAPNRDVDTIAAHHDGEDWTEEELRTIEEFKKFIKSQRKHKE